MCLGPFEPRRAEQTIANAPIPEEWLSEPVDLRQVEEDLADNTTSDSWLRQWRRVIGRMEPGDELWAYWHSEEGPEGEAYDGRSGYAVVRDGQVVDHIGEPFDSW